MCFMAESGAKPAKSIRHDLGEQRVLWVFLFFFFPPFFVYICSEFLVAFPALPSPRTPSFSVVGFLAL